jgi:N utilization substance protein A
MATAPAAVSANKAELLAIADAVAREKLIDKGIVIEAMEDAIQRAARARYGAENDIRAKLDPVTGDLRLWRVLEVVEEPEDHFKQIDTKGAQKLQKGAAVGDFIVDPLPPIEFGRIAAQAAKQVIFQKVRDAERERQFEEFKDRVGEIITGVVKRVEFGHVVVDLGRAEGVIRRDQQIPREMVRVGDRIRSLIMAVRREARGPQIFLSRAHPDFMKKLFAQEVPEIYDSIIEIKAAARDPGSRAKIGVISHACKRSSRNCRARRSTSSPGAKTWRPSSSTRSSRRRSAASSSTRKRAGSRWSSPTTSSAWRSAAAVRTCAWRASLRPRRSIS